MYKDNHIEAGSKKVPTDFKIPVVDVPYNGNGVTVWHPTDNDLESGVVQVLQDYAVVKHVGGNHRFLIHDNPPRIHHPDKNKHSVYWLDEINDNFDIFPWDDNSWKRVAGDRQFLKNSDEHFSQMQQINDDLRVFHAFGFAKESDKERVRGKKINKNSIQSQYRGHIHIADSVDQEFFPSEWLQGKQIFKNPWLLPFFLNTPGELAIQRYGSQLKNFGNRVTYTQSVGGIEKFDIDRTFFAFDSWESALNSVIELHHQLLESWIATAELIGDEKIEFAGQLIEMMQGSLPGFMLIKPSVKDKELGGIDPTINWLVAPFDLPLPQATLQSGVLFNRLQPEKQGSI